jgi:hypothetical protein
MLLSLRTMRCPGLVLLVLLCAPSAVLGGCTCGSKSAPSPVASSGASAAPGLSGQGSAGASASASGGPSLDDAVFSAPIAAARVGHVDVVAGLVAAEGLVRVRAVAGGKTAWTADALRGVTWAPDAELHLRPAGDGAALVWRGLHDGKVGRVLVLLGPHGEPRGAPTEIGAAFCATSDGMAWIDPRASGPSRVMARRWADAAAREVVAVSPDRDPALACASHAVYVLGDGDDDLTASSFVPGDAAAQPPRAVIRDADFGDDDEREHDAYTVGDDLALVRVGGAGALALREIPRGTDPGPWRKLKHAISPDDDVVAVDGDADATFVVFTHDADDACPGVGSTAESVRALRIDRKSGAETVLDLAAPDCNRSPGPFWIAAAPAGPTIGWVERATKLPPKAAPIAGVAVRSIAAAAGTVTPRRIDVMADAVADTGCDEQGCSVAALLRPAGGDGMQPEPIAVFAYP